MFTFNLRLSIRLRLFFFSLKTLFCMFRGPLQNSPVIATMAVQLQIIIIQAKIIVKSVCICTSIIHNFDQIYLVTVMILSGLTFSIFFVSINRVYYTLINNYILHYSDIILVNLECFKFHYYSFNISSLKKWNSHTRYDMTIPQNTYSILYYVFHCNHRQSMSRTSHLWQIH